MRRGIVLIVCAVFCVYVSSAKVDNPFARFHADPHKAMKEAGKIMKKGADFLRKFSEEKDKMSRRFNPQQIPMEFCKRGELGMGALDAICERNPPPDVFSEDMEEGFALFLANKSSAQQTDGLNKLCGNPCIKALVTVVSKPEIAQCIAEDEEFLVYFGHLIRLGCSQSNGRYCALEVTNRVSTMDCENFVAQSTCNDHEFCQWVVEGGWSRCDMKFTNALMDQICSPCMKLFFDLSASFEGDDMMAAICTKVSGSYCMPILAPLISGGGDEGSGLFNTTIISNVCSATAATSCVRMMMSNMFASEYRSALYQYSYCLDYSSYGREYCYGQLVEDYSSAQMMVAMGDAFCARNTAGDLCMLRVADAMAGTDTTLQNCFATVFGTGSCTGCETTISTFVTSMGCCLGVLHGVTTPTVYYPPADEIPGDLTQQEIDAMTKPVNDESISQLSTCGISDMNATLQQKCSTAVTKTVSKKVFLNIRYQSISATYRTWMTQTLKIDMAIACKISPTSISNLVLAAEESFKIELTAGTKLTFDIAGANWAVDYASAIFDQLTASNSLRAEYTGEAAFYYSLVPYGMPLIHHTGSYAITLPGSSIDVCFTEDYFTAMAALEVVCNDSSTILPLMYLMEGGQFSSNEAANLAFGEMCASQCFTLFKALMNTDYRRCIGGVMLEASKFMAISCEKSAADPLTYCGTTLTALGAAFDCDSRYSATECQDSAQCHWNSSTYMCEMAPTATFLGAVCNDCMGKMLGVFAGLDEAKYIGFADQFMCAKVGDQFCLPLVGNDPMNLDDLSNASITSFCSDATKSQCVRKVFGAYVGFAKSEVKSGYIHCAETYTNYGSTAELYIRSNCLTPFVQSVSQFMQLEKLVDLMCRKNVAGQYCLGFMDRNSNCMDSVMGGYTCTAACDAEISSLITELGCCAGTMQDIFQTATGRMRPEEIPAVNGVLYQPPDPSAPVSEYNLTQYQCDGSCGNCIATGVTFPVGVCFSLYGYQLSLDSYYASFSACVGGGSVALTVYHDSQCSSYLTSQTFQVGTCAGSASPGEKYVCERVISPTTTMPPSMSAGPGEEIVDFPGQGFFMHLSQCSSLTSIGQTLRRTCGKVRAAKVMKKELPLKVSYQALKQDPVLEAKMKDALVEDLSTKLGVAKDDFVKTEFKEDTSTKIQIVEKLVRRRRMVTLTAESATIFVFEIQTETTDATTAAETTYDTLVEEKALTLPATATVVEQECSTSCVGEEGAASIQTNVEAPSLTTVGGSSTMVSFTLIFAALLASLL